MNHLSFIARVKSARFVAPAIMALTIGPIGASKVALGDEGARGAYDFAYSGQLVKANGLPQTGEVDLEITFFKGESKEKAGPTKQHKVTLTQGTFHLDALNLDPGEKQAIFGGDEVKWIQIYDRTNDQKYPAQRITAVPYAMRVPVDGETVGFDEDGKLSLVDTAINAAIDAKLAATNSPGLRKADFTHDGLLLKNGSDDWQTVSVDTEADNNSIVRRDGGKIASKGLKIVSSTALEDGSIPMATIEHTGTGTYLLNLPDDGPWH